MTRTLVVATLVILVVAVATAMLTRDDRRARVDPATVVVNPAPSPVVSTTAVNAQRSSPTAALQGPAGAMRTARRFLRGYIALLYGRAPIGQVTHVSAAVRRDLRASVVRVPEAQRTRDPRLVDLRATRQARESVMVTATIDDGGLAVYPIVFTVERRAGRWLVSDLGNH